PKYTQHVEVTFTDPDPDAAQVAVNEVIAAYMKIVEERDNLGSVSKVKILDDTRALSIAKLNDLRKDVQVVTDDLGETALESRYRDKVDELNRYEKLLHELDVEIA